MTRFEEEHLRTQAEKGGKTWDGLRRGGSARTEQAWFGEEGGGTMDRGGGR